MQQNMTLTRKIFFSIIIPVLQINDYLLKETFPAIQKQSFKNFETIVLPNSYDNKDKKLRETYSWLKIIPTPHISKPAQKRNIGVKKAKGSYIVFLDDDAFPPADWLKKAYDIIQKFKKTVLVGPGILSPQARLVEQIFDAVLSHPFGSGTYTYRFMKKEERYVDDFPSVNFFILKKIFYKAGCFRTNYWPGEDSKLCNDLVNQLNIKIFYSPHIFVYHHRRNNILYFLKQHAKYGYQRGYFVIQGDRNSIKSVYFLPSLFSGLVLFACIDILYALLQTHFILPTYVFILPIIGILFSYMLHLILLQKNIYMIIIAPVVLFSMHFVYGIYFMKGLIKGLIHKFLK